MAGSGGDDGGEAGVGATEHRLTRGRACRGTRVGSGHRSRGRGVPCGSVSSGAGNGGGVLGEGSRRGSSAAGRGAGTGASAVGAGACRGGDSGAEAFVAAFIEGLRCLARIRRSTFARGSSVL